MISKFELIRNYFKALPMDYVVTRKEYLQMVVGVGGITIITADNCRCILMTAGYLARVKRGVYQKVNGISSYLTYTEARIEAYGY